jgi:hypothetical protein
MNGKLLTLNFYFSLSSCGCGPCFASGLFFINLPHAAHKIVAIANIIFSADNGTE